MYPCCKDNWDKLSEDSNAPVNKQLEKGQVVDISTISMTNNVAEVKELNPPPPITNTS